MSSQRTPGIQFGPFFLDTAGRRLLLSGRRVPAGPLELKLLETLLRHRERVLSGDELRILVWAEDPAQQLPPAQDVNALYVAIRKLRKALGEYGKWIVNISKVGYTISEEAHVEEITGEAAAEAPEQLTSFVGRKDELAKIRELLAKTRLLTLTGPPGIGKSRLANQAALAKNYLHGVCTVDFVSISDPALVPETVMRALGLSEQAGRGVAESLGEYLRDKHLLLLFDNCEHVVEACAPLVEQLLRASRQLQVIATSRETLSIPGETVLQVSPLSVPDQKRSPTAEELADYEAVELFVELAKQRQPAFKLIERDVAAVAELCRQLEGIPVAIELAAAQVDAYTVEQILSMMTDRFRVLRRRGGEASRHQTLEGAIAWSYELLGTEERMLLRRLSVFAGGWTHESATEVCAGEGIDERDVVHLLARLLRESLIQPDERKKFHRYRMLEMIRQYSRERLREAGEEAQLFARHSDYFLRLAERADEEGEKGDWPALLEADHDNLRAALQRNIRAGGDLETVLRMCGALVRFWFAHGLISEARRWTKKALELDDGQSRRARARALRTAGFFFGQMIAPGEDSQQGRIFFEESLGIWRELSDERELGKTLNSYSFLLNRQGDFTAACEAAWEGLNIFRARGEPLNLSRAANNLALSIMDQGDFEQALPLLTESLDAARRAEDKYLEAIVLHNLGDAAMQTGALAQAEQQLADSLALFELLGHRPLVARTALIQGEVAMLRGDHPDALDKQRGALMEFQDIGDTQGIATALEALACTQSARGRARLALLLNGGAASLRERIHLRLGPARQTMLDHWMDAAATALSDEAARQAAVKGREMTLEEIVRLALNGESAGQLP